jgi:hypothetical protein
MYMYIHVYVYVLTYISPITLLHCALVFIRCVTGHLNGTVSVSMSQCMHTRLFERVTTIIFLS